MRQSLEAVGRASCSILPWAGGGWRWGCPSVSIAWGTRTLWGSCRTQAEGLPLSQPLRGCSISFRLKVFEQQVLILLSPSSTACSWMKFLLLDIQPCQQLPWQVALQRGSSPASLSSIPPNLERVPRIAFCSLTVSYL